MRYRKADAKAYAREHLRGIWAATLTPFAADLRLDEAGWRRNLRHWYRDLGIRGLFVNGTTARVTNSVFRRNVAVNGGGVEADSNAFNATSSTFDSNRPASPRRQSIFTVHAIRFESFANSS